MADLKKVLPPSIDSNNSENSSSNSFPVDLKGDEVSNKSNQLVLPPKPTSSRDQKTQMQNNPIIQTDTNKKTGSIEDQDINNNQSDRNDQSNEIESLKNKTQEFFKRYKMENQDSRSSNNRADSSATTPPNIQSDFLLGNKINHNQNPLIIPSGSSPTPPREPSFIKMSANPTGQIPTIQNNGLQKTLNFKNKFLEATQSASSATILPVLPSNQVHAANNQYHLRQPSGDSTPKGNPYQENSNMGNYLPTNTIQDTNFQIENQPKMLGQQQYEKVPIFQTTKIISNTKQLEMFMYNNSIALKKLFG